MEIENLQDLLDLREKLSSIEDLLIALVIMAGLALFFWFIYRFLDKAFE